MFSSRFLCFLVTRYTWKKVVEVAKDLSGKDNLSFAIGDQESLHGLADFLGLGEQNEDVAVAIWGANNTRYPMLDEDFSEENLRDFVQSYLDKKLKPYVK